jgi:hypothetical protein
MIKKNTPSKPDTRRGTLLLAEVVSKLPLIVIVACLVAVLDSHARGSKKQRPTDKPATSKTLVAAEGV